MMLSKLKNSGKIIINESNNKSSFKHLSISLEDCFSIQTELNIKFFDNFNHNLNDVKIEKITKSLVNSDFNSDSNRIFQTLNNRTNSNNSILNNDFITTSRINSKRDELSQSIISNANKNSSIQVSSRFIEVSKYL